MENINIFESGSQPQRGEFFKFSKVGDEIQGTYIDLMTGQVDSYGNQQNIHILKTPDGKIWSVGVRLSNTILTDDIARRANFGQIIGFRYDRDVPSKKMPGKTAKVINLYADSRCVDNEWLSKQAETAAKFNTTGGAPIFTGGAPAFTAPVGAGPLSTNMPAPAVKQKNDAVDAIRNLAKTKGLTNETMSEVDADAAIEKYTGLELSELNLTKIIIALTSFSKK